jgi:hypothetical protein
VTFRTFTSVAVIRFKKIHQREPASKNNILHNHHPRLTIHKEKHINIQGLSIRQKQQHSPNTDPDLHSSKPTAGNTRKPI